MRTHYLTTLTFLALLLGTIAIVPAQTATNIITEAEVADLDGFPFNASQFDPIIGDVSGNILYFATNGDDGVNALPAIYSFDITADESTTAATLIVDSDDIVAALSLTNRVHFTGHIVVDGTDLFALCAEDFDGDGDDFVSRAEDLERLIRIDTTGPTITEVVAGGIQGAHDLEVVGANVYITLTTFGGAANSDLLSVAKTASGGSTTTVLTEATLLTNYTGGETFVDFRALATDGTDLFYADLSDAVFQISGLGGTPTVTEIINGGTTPLGTAGATQFEGLEVFSVGNLAVLDDNGTSQEGVFTLRPDATTVAFVDEGTYTGNTSIFQNDITLGPGDTIMFANNANDSIQQLANPTGIPVEISSFDLE